MAKSMRYAELADSLLEIIDEVGREKVPPGMIGFVGELFTLSRMCTFEEMKSIINYLGGRKPCDIEVGDKKVLVKTNLLGDIEKQKFGVTEGFLWSDLRVEKLSKRKAKPTAICFHFVVLVGIKNRQPKFYILTKDEFMSATDIRFGWKQGKGTRVIAVIKKRDDKIYNKLKEKEKDYVNYFSSPKIIDLFRKSEGKHGWDKIKDSISTK